MSATTLAHDVGMSPGPVHGNDLRVGVTAVSIPAAGTRLVRRTTDAVRLVRAGGRVVASGRLPAQDCAVLVARAREAADALLRAVHTGLERLGAGAAPAPVPQSILATVGLAARAGWSLDGPVKRPESACGELAARAGWSLDGPVKRPELACGELAASVLVRLESATGPILVGGGGADPAGGLLAALAGLPDSGPAGPPPAHWSTRPVVLRPAVAAVVVAGARLVLGTPAAARLAGRRVLPGLSLTDLPVEHPEGALDDAGVPAATHTLADRGRVAPLPREADTGLPSGRAVWQHDGATLAAAPVLSLSLTGPPCGTTCDGDGTAFDGDGTVELVRCVEGLRRYHPDGQLRLTCLARMGPAGVFLVAVRARPLDLLRAVTRVVGPSVATYTDHHVCTPSLLVPSADEMNRSCRVRLEPL